MTIGENIRKIRKQQGLTQKELAELAGLNEVTIRSYEAGKFKPKLENIKKLSKALGTYYGIVGDDWPKYNEEAKDDFLSIAVPYDAFLKSLERKMKHEEKLLLEDYRKLNSEGQDEARKRINEMTLIEKYTEIEPEPPE